MKKRIAVLISGGGTDLQSIIDHVKSGHVNGEIAVVVSSKAGVFGLERASREGIPTAVYQKTDFSDVSSMYDQMLKLFQRERIDLVVLAGYLTILTHNIVKAFENRILNIHPALIPSFCGKGFYGLKVHEAAIAYGVKLTGCTVHFVNEEADGGAIILQEAVAVLPSDTPETLQQRVLAAEHRLLPQAVELFCADKLRFSGRTVVIG